MEKAHIFLVEDEKIVAKDVQNRLRNMGYAIAGVASSGAEALQKVAETSPDVVLMDIVLQGDMDGVETSELLRQRFQVPIIYLTAYADDSTLQRAKITEPFGYLLKPYEERELHTTIELALYRHRMERKLQETERWLSTTLRSLGDAVLATDTRNSVRLINPAAASLTGWTVEEAVGNDLGEIFHLRLGGDNATGKVLRKGKAVAFPEAVLLVSKHGREVPVEGVASPIEDSDGNFTGFVLVFRDISERKRTEELRRQMEIQQFQTQKMEAIARLAGGVAHDFNNQLTAILGNTSLVLAGQSADDPNRAALEAVEKASLKAADLVSQLLGFARNTARRPKALNLNSSIQEVVELLHPLLDPTIDLQVDADPELWSVHADPAQIHHALLNMLLNARDAMPEGGRLKVQTKNVVLDDDPHRTNPRARPGDYVRVTVGHTGPGLTTEETASGVETFSGLRHSSPTGLGLALVFGIIEQHHGWIDRGPQGAGTQLAFYVPRYCQKAEVTPAAPLAEVARDGSKTILLADDEALVRDLGQTILTKHGYQVILAEDGVQAVEIFQRERARIDLVILDLTMPRLSGCDAFWKLLVIDPEVRVLFSSGYFAEDIPSAAHEHVLGFIGKPYRPDDLLQEVERALAKVKSSD